jgi:hypothetical protein
LIAPRAIIIKTKKSSHPTLNISNKNNFNSTLIVLPAIQLPSKKAATDKHLNLTLKRALLYLLTPPSRLLV